MTEAQSCHLAIVPNHAVVSRKDNADFVRRMLFNQQVWATEHSVHLQTCADTPQPGLTLFLPRWWHLILTVLPLMKAEDWWQCSLLFWVLLGHQKWTEKPQSCGHVKGLTKIPLILSTLMVPLGLVLSQK